MLSLGNGLAVPLGMVWGALRKIPLLLRLIKGVVESMGVSQQWFNRPHDVTNENSRKVCERIGIEEGRNF